MAVTKPVWTPSRGARSRPSPAGVAERGAAEAARARSPPCPRCLRGRGAPAPGQLAEAAAGRAFLLQAGECAESFHDLSAVHIREKLKIMLQMAAVLTYGATLPVVKVGRIAGQLAKARTSPTEKVGGAEILLPRPHGARRRADGRGPHPRPGPDGAGVQPRDGDAQPRARFTKGGFADLMRVHEWNQEFVASSPEGRRYEQLASEIERALRFMAACGIDLGRVAAPPGGRLDEPRGPRARLRGGAHPARLDDRRLVRLLGAHALDRGAHAPAGRGARRVLLRRPEPARGEGAGRRRRTRSSSSASGSTPTAYPGG